ncbi:hypothetical protein LSH36_44g12003 [Paralvinella palmiformis]|uniref:Uncharacterized protein n=1 Tax=Paralvinella palmiformis TaxID=53620 RepID=A0AAD9K738_9ANNE|nr:hypothetical protein LSH36_44g12003 [Paralvinella palmiformis]
MVDNMDCLSDHLTVAVTMMFRLKLLTRVTSTCFVLVLVYMLVKERAERKCYHLTIDGESSDHEEFINRGFDLDHPKDKQKIPAEKKTRSRTNIRTKSDRKEREILKHSLVLRTDDNKTIQTTPWGFPPDECSEKDYGPITDLPTVSVIICFHEHENIADVLHTVHSVVQRTPRQLVKRFFSWTIIVKKFVDWIKEFKVEISKRQDYNLIVFAEDFKQILEKYVSAVFTGQIVRIIRSERHMGLIQCRLHGAQLAQGDVLYFMDSHMEVQPRWQVQNDYLSCSPVTVGGVFAISKTFFFHVGAFDEGMCGWGGENLDLPIRVYFGNK